MINILLNPVEEFLKAKKQKSLGNSLIVLLAGALIMTIGLGLVAWAPIVGNAVAKENSLAAYAILLVLYFVVLVLFYLFAGYIASMVFKILTDKGTFFDGVTVSAYFLFISSVGGFAYFFILWVTGIINNPWVSLAGMLVGLIIMITISYRAFAAMARGFKEMFETDMVTVLTAYVVLLLPTLIYAIAFILGVIIGIVLALIPMLAMLGFGSMPISIR